MGVKHISFLHTMSKRITSASTLTSFTRRFALYKTVKLCRRYVKNIMNKILLILFACALQSCSSEDSATKTELEGTWVQCILSTQTYDFFGNVITVTSGPSKKVTTTYQGNTVSTLTETHSNTDCTNPTLTTGPEQESIIIGDIFTSINGVLVTEIDFLTNDYKTIYLLQDDDNTLYFGKQCTLTNAQCSNDRPLEINYDLPSYKVN